MSFNSTGPHYCPVCPRVTNKYGRVVGPPPMELIESNYSGSGFDVAVCRECRRVYGVAYVASSYVRMPEWEVEGPPHEDGTEEWNLLDSQETP